MNIIIVFAIILLAGFMFLHIAFDGIFTGPFYDKEDLIENYEKRKKKLMKSNDTLNQSFQQNQLFT